MAILSKKSKTAAKETRVNKNSAGADLNIRQNKSSFLVKQVWITEKAVNISGLRKYIFIVDRKVNKPEAKKAIEAIYKVKVADVNMVNMRGKSKRLGRSLGKTSAFKKAMVTLKEGHKIDVLPT
jgi:large subunit ribosomal protein L23